MHAKGMGHFATKKNRILFYANNKDSEQPVHPHRLVSAFVIDLRKAL